MKKNTIENKLGYASPLVRVVDVFNRNALCASILSDPLKNQFDEDIINEEEDSEW